MTKRDGQQKYLKVHSDVFNLGSIINVVGVGRVSSSVVRQLKGKVRFGYIVSRSLEKARLLAKEVGAIPVTYDDDFVLNGVILVGLNDSTLPDLQNLLHGKVPKSMNSEKNDENDKIISVHFSGFHSSNIFPKEWNPVSMHPNCAVADERTSFFDVIFGIEGSEKGREVAQKIVSLLNGKYVLIETEKKELYHLAAVISSNFLISLGYISSLMYKDAGISENISKEIISKLFESVSKNIKRNNLSEALTGPVKRGDWNVVKQEELLFRKFVASHALCSENLYADMVELLLKVLEKE